MRGLLDRAREMGWTPQAALCGLSEHTAADGVFVGEHNDGVA
jgi:hypothetical protein